MLTHVTIKFTVGFTFQPHNPLKYSYRYAQDRAEAMIFRIGRSAHRNEKKSVGQLLLEHNLISIDNLKWAQSVACEKGITLEEALLDTGVISESVLTSYLTFELKLPVVDITRVPSESSALEAVSKGAAFAYKALPLSITDGCLVVATGSPAFDRLKGLERLTGLKVREVVSLHGSIYEETLRRYRSSTYTESQVSADDRLQDMHPEELLNDTDSPEISKASKPKPGTRSRAAARKAKSKRVRRSLNKKTANMDATNPELATNGNQADTEGTQELVEQRSHEEEVNYALDGAQPEQSPSLQGSSEESQAPAEDYVTENNSPEIVADELEDSPSEPAAQEAHEAPMITLEDYSSDGGTESRKEMELLPRVEETLPAASPQVLQIDKLVIEAKNLEPQRHYDPATAECRIRSATNNN